ncbi:MAG: tetratricopeptide repeat protein [Terriglobales bacterium]
MEPTSEQPNLWSSTQAYVLSVVCLVVGIVAGYLLHAPNPAVSDARPTAAPPAAGAAPPALPTPDQMRHMADKAVEPVLAALQKDPNNPELLTRAGSIFFRTQQFPLAVEYFQRAVNAKPTAEAYVSLSNSYHYAGSDDRALESLDRALQIDPKSANALFNLGMLRWQVKNDPKAAIEAWQRLLKYNPDHPRRKQVESLIAKAKQHKNLPAQAKTDKPAM